MTWIPRLCKFTQIFPHQQIQFVGFFRLRKDDPAHRRGRHETSRFWKNFNFWLENGHRGEWRARKKDWLHAPGKKNRWWRQEQSLKNYFLSRQKQETALYGDFNIRETLTYFGSLYGMKKSQIDKSREVLMNLLSLPEETRRISTLR